MTMERSTVHSLLSDIAESPAPPSTMDITRAVAAGRRRVLVRRLAGSGAAALAVAAVLGLTAALMPGGLAAPGPDPAASTTPAPNPTMPVAAPAAFDPRVQYAQPGWLPPGEIQTGVGVDSEWLSVEAEYPSGFGLERVALAVSAAGHSATDRVPFLTYQVPPQGMAPSGPAEPVNGRPAQWLAQGSLLQWEYAPGAFAAVEVLADSAEHERQVAVQVAQQVQFGVNQPVLLPFPTTVIPAQLPLGETEVYQRANGWWSVQVGFGPKTVIPEDGEATHALWLQLVYDPANPVTTITGPNVTVNGLPARVQDYGDGHSDLVATNADGVSIVVFSGDPSTTALLPGGVVGIGEDMEILLDPADWR
jgi:hypothetical protein